MTVETNAPAVRPNRGLMARMLRALTWTIVGIFAVYFALAVWYFAPSPKVSRNFSEEHNAKIRELLADQLAWKDYLEAMIAMGDMRASAFDVPRQGDDDAESVSEWHAWLDANQDKIERIRRAADLKTLGAPLESQLSDDLLEMMRVTRGFVPEVKPPKVENPMLLGVLLPHLGEIRSLARMVVGDARRALIVGDADRFIRDIRTLVGMGRQSFDESMLISQLVGLAIHGLTLDCVREATAHSELFNDERWRALDAEVARITQDGLVLDLASERDVRLDIIQRFYSDDGEGDGHLVHSSEFSSVYSDFNAVMPRTIVLWHAFGPIRSVCMPSRKHLTQRLDDMVTSSREDQNVPLYHSTQWRSGTLLHDIDYAGFGVMEVVPFFESLQGGEVNPIDSSLRSRALMIMRCEAARTLIAIHRAKQATGAWPASLDSLVPTYLSQAPTDAFDGAPLRYVPPKDASALPLLYSVGVDGKDQGGVPADAAEGRDLVKTAHLLPFFLGQQNAPDIDLRRMDRARFDWVIWPEPDPLPN